MREGGPGRPLTLAIIAGIAGAMAYQGVRMVERDGIDGAGPALLLVAIVLILFLALWLLIKAALRSTQVTFVVSEEGVAIQPSQRQKRLDWWTWLVTWSAFLVSWKGGQWSAWQPFTPWKAVRRVAVDERARHIVISGGPWDIRLVCTAENFPHAIELVRARAPARTRFD